VSLALGAFLGGKTVRVRFFGNFAVDAKSYLEAKTGHECPEPDVRGQNRMSVVLVVLSKM